MDVIALLPAITDDMEQQFQGDSRSKRSLTQLIRDLLGTDPLGPTMRIMLWSENTAQAVSGSLLELISDMDNAVDDRLDVRISATTDGQEDVIPFVLAYNRRHTQWKLWIEDRGETNFPTLQGELVPAAQCRVIGPQLFRAFEQIFASAAREPEPAERIQRHQT